MHILDDLHRIAEIRQVIRSKPPLRRFYEEAYQRYVKCLKLCPSEGFAVELGSGGGFAKEIMPELITSDVLPYEGIDKVIDGTSLPFPNESVRMICMMNVFHHLTDVESVLLETQRCLMPGGRLFITDQHVGYISTFLLRYAHHEPFNPNQKAWKCDAKGPLSGANGALPWIVFIRDIQRFQRLCPHLKLVYYRPHTPLLYWFSGGLKHWTLVPKFAIPLVIGLDRLLLRLSSQFGSFAYIEVLKSPKE